MPRVVIDINSVLPLYSQKRVKGIGRTTKELVEALAAFEDLPVEVMLYSQNTRRVTAKLLETPFRTRHIMLPHKGWMNRIIGMTPLREIATGYDLLHIPHNFEWVHRPERTIVTLHDALFFAHPEEVYNHEYAQKVYPTLARQARGIITCSESSKRDIMRYMDIPEEKIDVCPWGVREDIFHPTEEQMSETPYFLSVSCSMGRKNTMTVVRAFEKFLKNSPSHNLVLVWPKPPQEVNAYCDREHLRNKVHIIEYVDDIQLNTLYNGATATFFPSRYEGFGLPVLESMACGTPVVTYRNSSLPEVGGDAAIYVESDDVDGMSGIMGQFEQGTLSKVLLREQCLIQAAKFTWRRCAEKTVKVYLKRL